MRAIRFKYFIALFAFVFVSFLQHKEHITKDIQGIHSWRQSQTMWNIRNFVRHDANILNPRINSFNGGKDNTYRYEFPIMQWSIAMVQKIGGEKIEIVRIIIFLIGIGSILGIFFLIQYVLKNWLTALVAAVLFQYSPVFFYYTINPIPDNLALCGGIWYIYFIVKYFNTLKNKHLILGSISLLMATLAKLPFLMFSILSVVFFISKIIKQKKLTKQDLNFVLIQFLILTPAFFWYAWVMPSWGGNPILTGVFGDNFSMSESMKIIHYHATEMFPNILMSAPVWILFFIGLYDLITNKYKASWVYSLICITIVYLLLELNTIGTGHDYYMFPFLPWLFLVIGFGIESIRRYSPLLKYGLVGLCIWSAIYTYKETYSMWSLEKTYFNEDVFLYSKELKDAVPPGENCIILNDISSYVFSYRIDKMGYIFKNDYLPVGWIDDMVRNHNVQYMYSDSEKINNDEDVKRYIDEVILTKGTVKVMKLKVPDEKQK